jgi:hypothetical protein
MNENIQQHKNCRKTGKATDFTKNHPIRQQVGSGWGDSRMGRESE